MTALLEQATINEHRNTIVHHPLMGSTGHAAPCGNYEGTRSGAAYGDDPCRFLKGVRGRPSLA